jgi:hypothetical protein
MFSDSERDRLRKLGTMYETALERCHGNRIEARETMAKWLPMDRHYDGLDPEQLAKRVEECRNSGARLSLDDERLKSGRNQFITTTGRRY